MSERQVSPDGQYIRPGRPFFVVATQNPYEFEGTYPLPESQLDRFLVARKIGYPDRAAERDLLVQHRQGEPVEQMRAVAEAADVLMLQERVREVKVDKLRRPTTRSISLKQCARHAEIVLGEHMRAGPLSLRKQPPFWMDGILPSRTM